MAATHPHPATARPVSFARRWLRRLLFAASIVAALILVAWLAVPPLARHQIETRLTEALRRPTTVEKVEFDPFALRLVVHRLTIAGAAGAPPLLTTDEIAADLSSASLWHRAPVLDALRIVRPAVALARQADGRYDVDDLVERARAPSDGSAPAFSLNNIEIVDGSLAFDDAHATRTHRIDAIALGIPFLSTLPYETDIRVTPHVAGNVNGSPFAVGGTATPFAAHREATLDLDLDAVSLPQYLAYLPWKPRVQLASARLTTRLTLAFVDGPAASRRLELRGEARLDDLAVERRDGTALLGARRVDVTVDRLDVLGQEARIARVSIDAPVLDVVRARDGTVELAQPWWDGAAPDAAAPAPVASRAWSVRIASLGVRGGTLAATDGSTGFRTELADLAVDASNLTNVQGEKAKAKLSFVSADRVASFEADVEADLLAPSATGSFALSKFSLALLLPYYRDALAVDVRQGSLDLAGAFALTADGKATLADGKATLSDLALAYPGARQPFLRFPSVVVTGIATDVAARRVQIAGLDAPGAAVEIARERDGSVDIGRIIRTSSATGTAQDADTWTVAVARLAFRRGRIDIEDRVQSPAVKLTARELDLVARNWSNARNARASVVLRTRLGPRARAGYDGVLGNNPFLLAGNVDVEGLDLVALRPYVESQVNVSVTGGTLAAKGRLAIDPVTASGARATWKGNVTVSDFVALDKPTASDLARWKRLSLDDLDVTSTPFRLSVDRIDAADYYARVIVYQDGTLNLTRLLTPGAAPEPAPDARPAPAPAGPAEAVPVTIGRVDLANGNVNFSDFFVQPNYSANLTEVTGSISRMSMRDAGDVAITARVDHSAPVEVSGRIHPFAASLALDLMGKARDIDLPPLSPYAIKYAGYGIEKGKLTFDVHYRIEDRKLQAQNRLVLDQLTFDPKRIDSPTATKLPVLLAVSLLKNSRGVIDLQLPIAGSLDDPRFSVGGLIVQVIVNLITKAVTAPFALLSAAFGNGEELSMVAFAPGSSTLADEAKSRLQTLGKALADRPALRLDVSGRADPLADRDALRRNDVEDTLRRAKLKSLAAEGKAPRALDEVVIAGDERARWLGAAYRDAAIPERPRNALGLLQDVPPAQMEAMLLAHATADDDDLRLLANARSQAVKDALVAKSIASDRIFITAPRIGGEAAPRVDSTPVAGASRVDLSLR